MEKCHGINPELKTFKDAFNQFLRGESVVNIKATLSKYKTFKEAIASMIEICDFKVPELPIKKLNIAENCLEEEKAHKSTDSLLGKRKEPESSKMTKLGTKDIGSFFSAKSAQSKVSSDTITMQ
jgi:hypothetical protein